jgi:pimeloyl-ACP methyl ester carboxylesterase
MSLRTLPDEIAPAPEPLSSAASNGRHHAILRRSWPLIPALAVLAVFAVGISCTPPGRAAVSGAFFFPDMMAPLPLRPVTWSTDTPIHEQAIIRYGDRDQYSMPIDVYRPGDGKPHGAMILSPGAPPLEPDDPRLIRLSGDIARAGFVMLIPYSPDLEAEMIYPREVDALVKEFQYLQQQSYVKQDKIGYIGVSVGSPLALLAAADSRINNDVAYVVSFGGYYNADDVLSGVTTGVIGYDGMEESWTPDQHSVDVMAEQVINRLTYGSDRDLLMAALVDRKPNAGKNLWQLTPEGRAAFNLLTNHDPAQVDVLLAKLPEEPRQALSDLSLDGKLQGLRAETFILHDTSDHFVPYTESRRLRDALEGQVKLHFTEVDIFQHVEPTINRDAHVLITDSMKLYFHLYQILTHFR